MKPQFFVVYDYGQGGVWAIVEADRRELIIERFPEVQVFDERPPWMTDEVARQLQSQVIYLELPTGLLADIMQSRE